MVSKKKYARIEDSDSDSPPTQYEVDQILGTRKRRGKTQYLIKWVGYSSEHNSWEPEENLSADLIAPVMETNEETTAKKAEQNESGEPATVDGNNEQNESPPQLQSGAEDNDVGDGSSADEGDADEGDADKGAANDGDVDKGTANEGDTENNDADKSGHDRYKFEDGFSVLKILAAKLVDGELMFLFQYENSNEGEFVPAKIANVRFPQNVIEFYEGITLWAD